MTKNRNFESLESAFKDLNHQSRDLEMSLQSLDAVEIEVVDKDVPIIAVDSIEMIPIEQVEQWFEDLRGRIDEATELAEERKQQHRELEQELDGLEQLVENSHQSSGSDDKVWIECTVKKAYKKNQKKLIEDGQYCALGSGSADELDISECQELKVRRADQPEKSAVYTVDEIRDQNAKIRIGKNGRKRIDAQNEFEAEVLPESR